LIACGSTDKACRLIREAGRNGARVIGFPEGSSPRIRSGITPLRDRRAVEPRLATELFKNSVEIPGRR
jgi:predicted amidohydrolase